MSHLRARLVLGLILLVGAALRLTRLDAAQFRDDEYVITGLARAILASGPLPTGVPSSVGIDNGPVGAYLLAVPFLVSSSPTVAGALVALLNIGAIALVYALVRDMFGQRAGLLAAALFAVNPWLVVTGRRLWINSLIAPSAVFLLWAVHGAARHRTWPSWGILGIALAASVQTHLSSVANLFALAPLLPLARAIRTGWILLVVTTAILLILPWLIGSLLPDITRFAAARSTEAAPGFNLGILQRVSVGLTGGGYQAVAGQGARILSSTSWPFAAIDPLIQALGAIGWAYLIWVAWRQRSTRPDVAVTCGVAAAMVAIPVVALVRPPQAGALAFLGPHQLMNVLPPLLIGVAGLSRLGRRGVGHLVTLACGLVIAAQLALAVPFFSTLDEYWPESDYGIPWRSTSYLLTQLHGQATAAQATVMVGGDGDSEHQLMTARLLQRDYPRVRMHDGRDGLVFPLDAPALLLVSTDDRQSLSRFLRQAFANAQVVEQRLPGSGWTRRAFRLAPSDLESWAVQELPEVPAASRDAGPVRYERAAVIRSPLEPQRSVLALAWRFQTEPVEAFFTETVLLAGERVVLREPHLAYPAPFMEPGDWRSMMVLNLFDLPPGIDLTRVDDLALVHNGVRTGRDVAPAVRFPLARR